MIQSADNTIFVLQRTIRRFRIKVTDSTIKEFLLSHPYYPTLKSVCDALKKWKVDYYPLKLEPSEIRELERPFIAHLNVSGGQVAFVEGIKDNQVSYIAYKGKMLKERFEVFSEKLSGAVILVEKGKSGEKDYRLKRQNEALNQGLLPFGITTISLLFLFNLFFNSPNFIALTEMTGWELLSTKSLGITASIFLILKEWKISTRLTEKICHFNSQTDCDAVLSSPVSRLFGWVNWADAGLIYFTGTLLFLSGIPVNTSLGLLALISLLSLPYPVFSIYYQSVKLKKWCPFCLVVQLVLVAEFIILFPFLKMITFPFAEIIRFLLSFLIPAVFWLTFKAWQGQSGKREEEQASLLKLKRDPDLFRFLLTKNGYTEPPGMEERSALVLGNPNAPVTVTAFLSLYCNPCAEAFKQLRSLLERSSDLKIQAVFSVYHDEKTLKLVNTIYYLYHSKGSEAVTDFLYRWYSSAKELRETLSSPISLPEDFNKAGQVAIENKRLFETCQVSGTPTIFVNGYKFPGHYEYQDLEYHIDDLKQYRESKRQEAHTI